MVIRRKEGADAPCVHGPNTQVNHDPERAPVMPGTQKTQRFLHHDPLSVCLVGSTMPAPPKFSEPPCSTPTRRTGRLQWTLFILRNSIPPARNHARTMLLSSAVRDVGPGRDRPYFRVVLSEMPAPRTACPPPATGNVARLRSVSPFLPPSM